MTYEQLINKINEKIKENGEGDITGNVLNEVLRDIVSSVEGSVETVHVAISDTVNAATFRWPYDDTLLDELSIEGYSSRALSNQGQFPLAGMRIGNSLWYAVYYEGRGWRGSLTQLNKDGWYYIQYNECGNANCSIYIGRQNS